MKLMTGGTSESKQQKSRKKKYKQQNIWFSYNSYRPMWAHETICERGKLHSFISISMEDISGIYTEVYCKLEISAGKNQSR